MRALILGAALLSLVLWSNGSPGQAPTPAPPRPPEKPPAETPQNYVTQQQLDGVLRLVESQSDDLRKLRTDYEQTKELLRQQMEEQRQLLDRISRRDSAGTPIVNLNANMQSPEFQSEMASAVNRSLGQYGVLRVENQMPTDQVLAINYSQYVVPAMTSRDFQVPLGTVTTQLVNYEPPKHLSITAPSYFQRLVIAPSVAPPVVVEPMAAGY